MAKIENRDGLYSLAYDDSNDEGWQKPWGIASDKCFAVPQSMGWREALTLARADFTVEPREVFSARTTPDENGKRAIRAPGHQAIVRTDLETVLGITGDRYVPVQYRDVLALLEGTSYTVDAAAVLDGGSRFYAQAKVSTDTVPGTKGDRLATYLTILASHDGSSGVVFGRSDVRIVCANTLARATVDAYRSTENGVNENEGTGRVKHTKGATEKLMTLGKALQRIEDARRRQLEVYGKLASTKVDSATVKATIAAAWPSTALDSGQVESTTGATRTANVRSRVLEIFETGAHNTPQDGTAWSLWQAVTAYMSHESGVRGVTGEDAQVTRWLRSTLEGNQPAERALQFLTASAA